MQVRRVCATLVSIAVACTAGSSFARPGSEMVADPYYAYLVEGQVLQADGKPAANVAVMRTETANGLARFRLQISTTTDAVGMFRFADSGIGYTPGYTWYLAIRPPGCPGAVVTVTLQRQEPGGGPRDISTGTIVRLPPCTPGMPTPTPTPTQPLSDGDTFVLRAIASATDLDACFSEGRRGRNLVGALQSRLEIDARGNVRHAKIYSSAPQIDERTKRCYAKVMAGWHFAAGDARELDSMYGDPSEPQ